MPEVQLTEPLDHAAKKGGFKEVLATVEAAVEADVEALRGPGRIEARDSRPSRWQFAVKRLPPRPGS